MSQNNRLLFPNANTFVGAYDAIPSIAAAYSTRRLLTSYTGPLLRLVADRTGYPEQDIGYTAAGDLDTAAAASFLSGDAGYVTKWYDQSGNTNDVAQATLASMPLYVASSKPVLRFNNSLLTDSDSSFSQPLSILISGLGTSTTSGAQRYLDGSVSRVAIANNADGNFRLYAGVSLNDGASTTNATNIRAVVNGAFSAIAVNNGTETTGNAGAFALQGTLVGFGAGTYHAGDIWEIVICSAAWDAGAKAAVESAANAYWNIY